MADCCEAKADELDAIRASHARVLWTVLAINGAMFVVEFGAGLLAGSSALLADSLDMLGDSFVYGFSLLVIHRSLAWHARAALFKGVIMAAFGVVVLVEVSLKLLEPIPPLVPTMATIGLLALAANLVCFGLLYRHRADNINLRSTWLCSRNDLIANSAVLGAAGLVAIFGSAWPDILVGLGIAVLFLRTAATVLKEAFEELGRAQREAIEGAGRSVSRAMSDTS